MKAKAEAKAKAEVKFEVLIPACFASDDDEEIEEDKNAGYCCEDKKGFSNAEVTASFQPQRTYQDTCDDNEDDAPEAEISFCNRTIGQPDEEKIDRHQWH